MYTCTFFGHRDVSGELEPLLMSVIENLISSKNVSKFYIGNQGNFDSMVKRCLIRLEAVYKIDCMEVFAYFPDKNIDKEFNTIYPEGFENVPPKFAISRRNAWMIDHSDYVVVYVNRGFGGAARFKTLAERKGKKVINLAK